MQEQFQEHSPFLSEPQSLDDPATPVNGLMDRLNPLIISSPLVTGVICLLAQHKGYIGIVEATLFTAFAGVAAILWNLKILRTIVTEENLKRDVIVQKLEEREFRLRDIFTYSQGILSTHDLEGNLTSVNPAFAASLKFSVEQLEGKNLVEFLPKKFIPEFRNYIRAVVNQGECNGLASQIAKDGSVVIWQYRNILISDPGREPYVLGTALDVTHLMRTQSRYEKLSITDELTGIYNRRGFLTLADQQLKLERHQGTSRGLHLVFADMDGLKSINDQFGHEAGSTAIAKLASIIKSSVRDADLVARWGGDEFVMLLIGAGKNNHLQTIERIRSNINKHNENSDLPYQIECSIGSVIIEYGDTGSIESLISAADDAMYANKVERKQRRKTIADAHDGPAIELP